MNGFSVVSDLWEAVPGERTKAIAVEGNCQFNETNTLEGDLSVEILTNRSVWKTQLYRCEIPKNMIWTN